MYTYAFLIPAAILTVVFLLRRIRQLKRALATEKAASAKWLDTIEAIGIKGLGLPEIGSPGAEEAWTEHGFLYERVAALRTTLESYNEIARKYIQLQADFESGVVGGCKNLALLNRSAALGEMVIRDVRAQLKRDSCQPN